MAITPVRELVAQAKRDIKTLSRDEASVLVASEAGLLIDIRDVRELAREGKIPGAVHAPRGMLEFWADPASPYHREVFATEKTLILYCASAWRSALAAKALQDMGFDNVAELDGGFSAWKSDGRDIEPPPKT